MPARETDAEAVVQLQSTVFYSAWGSEWMDKALFGLFQAEVRSIVQQKLKMEDDSFQCILAVSHNTASKPVAVVEVSLQSNQEVLKALAAGAGETYAYVACMAVQEDFRRQGIALQLLKAAEKQARAWKQEVLALHVYKTNDVALKAYEKAGYTLLQVDGAWRAMLGAKQRILMYKSL